MDKISKFLSRLSQKEFFTAQDAITQILAGDISKLDVKKLKGQDFFFRVRKGDTRIIFWRKGVSVRIVAVLRRNEKTYRLF